MIYDEWDLPLTRIRTPKKAYTFDYPQAVKAWEDGLATFWFPDEISVEKDVQSILVDMTEAERESVKAVLKLFTLYEVEVADNYWCTKFPALFPRPEIKRAAQFYGMVESSVHAPFYSEINVAMGIATDDFFLSYLDDPILKARIDSIGAAFKGHPLVGLAAFVATEAVTLMNQFAFLKHFRANGKNKINNIVRGINFSLRDEDGHGKFGGWAFQTYLSEMSKKDRERVWEEIRDPIEELFVSLYEHERIITRKTLSFGEIEGFSIEDAEAFLRSRINVAREYLGLPKIFDEGEPNPIAGWFYKGIEGFSSNDTFDGVGNQYRRDWKRDNFTW